MNNETGNDMNTLEMAGLYERQGYTEDARKIYEALVNEDPSDEARAGLERCSAAPAGMVEAGASSPRWEKMASLLEQWIELLVVQQRMENFKRIKKLLS